MGIGKAIERACADLPEETEIIVSLEKDAGDCIAQYRCAKCSAVSKWLPFATITEAAHGITQEKQG